MKSRKKATASGSHVVAEIGNGWFKLAELSVRRDVVFVSQLHVARVPGREEFKPEALAAAADKMGLARGSAMAFLPREVVSVRVLDLPSTDPRELADMIDLQVDKQTPYSSDEILSEFRVLNTDGGGYSRVMLAIVQRNVLRHRFHMLEEAGFDVAGMSISSEGLVGWHTHLAGEPAKGATCHAVLDVDYSYSDLALVRAGQLCHTSSIRIGAWHLQADHVKGVEALCRDVDRSLTAFRSSAGNTGIDKIFLTGASSHARGLASRLSETHDCVVQEMPPTRGIEFGPDVPDPTSRAYALFSLTPLAGIALRGYDTALSLVPEPVKMRKKVQLKAGNLHVMGVRIMAVLLLIGVVLVAKVARRKALLDQLVQQRNATETDARELEEKELKTRIITERMDKHAATVNILRELHRLIGSATLHLARLELADGAVTLRGSANTLSDVIKFAGMLEESDLFTNVENTRTTQKKGTTDFEITCKVEGA